MKCPSKIAHQHEALVNKTVLKHSRVSWLPKLNPTGFVNTSSRYDFQHCLDSLAFEYLVNTQNKECDPEYENTMQSCFADTGKTLLSLMQYEDDLHTSRIDLPEAVPLRTSLDALIRKRRSIRSYTGDAINLNKLSSLLFSGCGITTHTNIELFEDCNITIPIRSVPSAGALYPFDILCVCINVNSIPSGVYRYLANENCLIEAANPNVLKILIASFKKTHPQVNITKAGAILMLVAKPWKTLRNYGDRGLRYVLHECGSISQNIHLAATALNLGSVDCSNYYESEINEVLGLDGKNKILLHAITIGVPGIYLMKERS